MKQEEMWLLRDKWDGEKTEGFFADCARLTLKEPLAYVIGSIPFLNTTIYLDLPAGQAGSRPLIPRTETEYWVAQTIEKIKKTHPNESLHILDLCAGSGCIGVAVLKEIRTARVDFVEIDTGHHPTIHKNIVENDINLSRTRIFGGDLFENIRETYDYILSNPPYIDPEIDRTEEGVVRFEPHTALYGGLNGMEFITQIVQSASHFLKEAGTLVLEHEPEQVEILSTIAQSVGFTTTTHLDQFGTPRYTYLVRNK